jgi:hypothetical protein
MASHADTWLNIPDDVTNQRSWRSVVPNLRLGLCQRYQHPSWMQCDLCDNSICCHLVIMIYLQTGINSIIDVVLELAPKGGIHGVVAVAITCRRLFGHYAPRLSWLPQRLGSISTYTKSSHKPCHL